MELRSGPDRLANDVRAFTGVLKSSGSLFKAIRDGFKIALSGRRFMKNIDWPMHVLIEQRSDAAVNAALQQVREIIAKHQGREIENSIPKIVRANPFGPLNNIVGPKSERWAPTHGLVPLSKGVETLAMLEGIFERNRQRIDQHGIITGYLFNCLSTNGMLIEPVFFWPEGLEAIHHDTMQDDFIATLPEPVINQGAHQAVAEIKQEIMDQFRDDGAIHLQIGKSYHYATGIKPESLQLIQQIKAAVDPKKLMNPGVLGL
jgi:glycolate oxidase